jgi:hypothetical protein
MPQDVPASGVLEIRSRPAGRVPPLSWLLLLLSWLIAAVTLVLALASPPSEPVLIATRRIAVVRTSTGREVVGGVSPVLRARRLIAMMRLDLTRLTEQQFLAEWGDRDRWKQRFSVRKQQAERARRYVVPSERLRRGTVGPLLYIRNCVRGAGVGG